MAKRSRKKSKWTLKDLVTLESQIFLDRELDEVELEVRDRHLFRQSGESLGSNRELLRGWKDAMVKERPIAPDPGKLFRTGFEWITVGVALLAIFLGASSSVAVLQYDGTVPVNVSVFLGLIVLPQMLMLLGFGVILALSVFRPTFLSVVYAVPLRLGKFVLQLVWKKVSGDRWVNAKTRDEITFQVSDIVEFLNTHRSLFAIRIFRLVQIAGVWFNIAVLSTMVLLLSITDRAFGWQSSFVDSPEQVDHIVEWVSTPWRAWVGDVVARPSFEEIVGSRIILSETELTHQSSDLLSWWPFLMLCVFVYGLFPRLIAWLFSVWQERRLLDGLSFSRFSYQVIVERMQSLDLKSEGLENNASKTVPVVTESRDVTTPTASDKIRYWMLDGMVKRYSEETLQRWLTHQLGVADLLLDRKPGLQTEDWSGSVDPGTYHYLLMEGWQPPIQETLRKLELLAHSMIGNNNHLILVLVGKPSNGGIRELSETMVQVWKSKVQLLKCANLRVFNKPNSAS